MKEKQIGGSDTDCGMRMEGKEGGYWEETKYDKRENN